MHQCKNSQLSNKRLKGFKIILGEYKIRRFALLPSCDVSLTSFSGICEFIV